MCRTMGDREARAVALASVFGFVSSSCSSSALAKTRALFAEGVRQGRQHGGGAGFHPFRPGRVPVDPGSRDRLRLAHGALHCRGVPCGAGRRLCGSALRVSRSRRGTRGTQRVAACPKRAVCDRLYLLAELGIPGDCRAVRLADPDRRRGRRLHQDHSNDGVLDRVLFWLACAAGVWLAGGLALSAFP